MNMHPKTSTDACPFEAYAAAAAAFIDDDNLFDPWEQWLPNAKPSATVDEQQQGAAAKTPIDFLKTLFAHTEGQIYTCSFPNERDDGRQDGERHVISRKPAQITRFINKWDKPERGLFFCVGTVKPGAKRNKDNIAETICLHGDLDFAKIDGNPTRDEVLRQLKRLKHQPSAIVFSGNGVHCYWLFKEALATQGNIERIEAALRQLADLVAGDLPVCEASRVLRMPGSHNTKDGAWTEVEVISLDADRRYELDDLEEWLSEQSPVMFRKEREFGKTVGEVEHDFFARYAKEFGIKAPIDVEARLCGMMYMGGGDSSIHQTQLAVSAALLNQNVPTDEVVAILMDATRRAAGEYGVRWNWKREERNLNKMCDTWLKKHPPEERKKKVERAEPELKSIDGGKAGAVGKVETGTVEQQQAAGGATVIQLTAAKAAVAKKSAEHVTIADAVLAYMDARGEALINGPQGAWLYAAGIWSLRTDINAWLNTRIEAACDGLGFTNKLKLTSEVRSRILRRPELWRDEIPWDQHGKIPTRSGLIDPLSGELEAARPDHFCTWRIECDYDPQATCPWWVTYLDDLFIGDDKVRKENIRVIQEVLGAALIDKKPRGISKAFVAQGETNTGKSGLVNVMGGLFGSGNEITTPLEALEGAHGLMPFIKRAPWVLHEAFRPGKWHLSSDFKAIVTHNAVMINIKNGPMLRTVVRSPIFWATNYLPQFRETTKAIVSRIIVVRCTREFAEDAPLVGAAAEARRLGFAEPSEFLLATEMPGILNWAIAGLQAALKRGFIELSDSIRATANEIRRDGNPVAAFVEECIKFNPKRMVSIPDFCMAFSVWHEEQRGEGGREWGNRQIGKLVRSLSNLRIAIDDELRKNVRRYYGGVMLNDAGANYWRRGVESRLFEGKASQTSAPGEKVNLLIPFEWDNKTAVVAMRKQYPDFDPNSRSGRTPPPRGEISLDEAIDVGNAIDE
jgi:P4 family phage/plasmid primase-like protien